MTKPEDHGWIPVDEFEKTRPECLGIETRVYKGKLYVREVPQETFDFPDIDIFPDLPIRK